MATVKFDDIVQVSGEQFVRRVIAVDGQKALCQRFASKDSQWFLMADLTVQPPR